MTPSVPRRFHPLAISDLGHIVTHFINADTHTNKMDVVRRDEAALVAVSDPHQLAVASDCTTSIRVAVREAISVAGLESQGNLKAMDACRGMKVGLRCSSVLQ